MENSLGVLVFNEIPESPFIERQIKDDANTVRPPHKKGGLSNAHICRSINGHIQQMKCNFPAQTRSFREAKTLESS